MILTGRPAGTGKVPAAASVGNHQSLHTILRGFVVN